MESLLLVIDLQNNFVNDLTENIPDKVKMLLESKRFDNVVFTKFINDENSQFYNVLDYRGCIKESDRAIVVDTGNAKIIEKNFYTAYNDELVKYIKDNNINTIYLCGIDTDACVLKTALDLFENNYDVKVIEDCSMSHSGKEYHDWAIMMLQKLIGKQNIIKVFN